MSNILKGLLRIAENPIIELVDHYESRNRINNVGAALERYIQDIFANTLNEQDETIRNLRISETFSYLGNQNNPPDMMLHGSDAIEVKKIQSLNASIALNSSYPKSKLFEDDPKLTTSCKNCEEWDIKDIIYCIGTTSDNSLKHIWMVYGDCYAADKETYLRIQETISQGINSIQDVEFSETKELGRVNKVDPLGITRLRIRGMWHIDNPMSVYSDLYSFDEQNPFGFACLLSKSRFDSFLSEDIHEITENENLLVQEVQIKNPNNLAILINAILITYRG